jgi:UDP-N-acetyl-D-glucosamine dehydrogenase
MSRLPHLWKSAMKTNLPMATLLQRISRKSAIVGIFGVGYVGLPLACAFAAAGFKTIAADTDRAKVLAIRDGRAYVEDAYVKKILPKLSSSKRLQAEYDISHVASTCEVGIIAVPTPLTANQPDLSYVQKVIKTLAGDLRPGKLIVLESSVYPGTTENVLKPILEKTGLRAGHDFALAHSPERIDYHNKNFGILNTPKVVGGVTPTCTNAAVALYKKILRAPVIRVSSAGAAEATKMLENTYRYVNIALANELSGLFEKLGLDAFEVIVAASTKPFGFQPFYPGPGVGGHCIPKDPHYLAFSARQVGVTLRLVELSAQINDGMVNHILERIEQLLVGQSKTLKGSKATILGLAFKADVSDWRRSPSITLAERLGDAGAQVSAYDPLIKRVDTETGKLVSARTLNESLRGSEILILATPHSAFRKIKLSGVAKQMRTGGVIVDTRGFWTRSECEKVGLNYLGIGRP